jgi:alkylhydroperoxidase family enzyme
MEGMTGSQLSAELIDGITEAVASPTDARVRADVISDLIHEVDEAVKWRNERHPGGEEEQSLATLTAAAAVHRHRMDDVDDEVDEEDAAHRAGGEAQASR